MPRRLAWVILASLATVGPPAQASTIAAEWDASASADSLIPASDWRDTARAPSPGSSAADADLAGLTIAMAVQPTVNGARVKAGAPIAPATTAKAKIIARLPEPATWVMLILGFGGIGAAVRRQLRRSDERFNEHIRRIAASGDEIA